MPGRLSCIGIRARSGGELDLGCGGLHCRRQQQIDLDPGSAGLGSELRPETLFEVADQSLPDSDILLRGDAIACMASPRASTAGTRPSM